MKSAKKLAANIVHLATPTHVAIFNSVLLDEIRQETGRWFNVRTKDHHLPFLDCQAIVTPEGAIPGVQFSARKLNYNFNDSNWVGDDSKKVVDRINSALVGIVEKPLTKKDVYFFLEDIKNTLKGSKWAPAPVTETETQTA